MFRGSTSLSTGQETREKVYVSLP